MPIRFRLLLLCLVPTLAAAHPEHDLTMTFAQGLWHPLSGLDHLLAMIAVGAWAARLGRAATLALPIAFPLGMLIGAGLAMSGVALPAFEPVIAISVIALGALIAFRVGVNVTAASLLIAAFAVFHGYAHAVEAPGAMQLAYAVGFVIATVALHLVGLLAGIRLLKRVPMALPAAGSAISLAGAALLLML